MDTVPSLSLSLFNRIFQVKISLNKNPNWVNLPDNKQELGMKYFVPPPMCQTKSNIIHILLKHFCSVSPLVFTAKTFIKWDIN